MENSSYQYISKTIYILSMIGLDKGNTAHLKKNSSYSITPNPGLAVRYANATKAKQKAFYYFLNSKKLRLSNQTIWENCFVLDRGSVFSERDKMLFSHVYWPFKYEPQPFFNSVDELIEIYKNAVNIRLDNRNAKGLTLTGGLDSRTMICAVNEENLSKINAYTSGIEGCTEIKYASKVCDKLSVNHKPFFGPEDIFTSNAFEYFQDEEVI